MGRHSKRFYLDCATDDFEGVCGLKPPNVTFPPERLLVLTEGYCASTCATFMHRFQSGGYGRIAGVGGIKYAPLETSSTAGGFTGNIHTLNSLRRPEEQIPGFPTNGGVGGFAWAEVYDHARP